MPKDPEKNRERAREWYWANRERANATSKAWREANREHVKAANQRRYQATRAKRLEAARQWAEANPERVQENQRRWREENRARKREQNRRWREAGNLTPKERRRNAAAAELWHEQDGRCYLCERPFPLEGMHLEHDHRCCPTDRFCSFCIRGVSCPGCNYIVGHGGDDPDRLETIARNLRAKLAEMDARLATRPRQPALDEV